MNALLVKRLACSLLLAGLATGAMAGRACETRPLTATKLERSLSLAQQTALALNTSNANVVLLARAGQDLSQYHLRWSHLGWAYRDQDAAGQTTWRVVHKLNTCGTRQASLYRQGLGEFFMDDPWRYEAAWVIPSPDIQNRLLPLLRDNAAAAALHHSPYSMVSYVWGLKYQQSNQWALETLAAAMAPTEPWADTGAGNPRVRAQDWLQRKGYTPTVLNIGPFTRLGARVGSANVAFDDHPNEKRYSDRIETVTVDSMFAWMQATGMAGRPQRLQLR